jgi:hypothetical protein
VATAPSGGWVAGPGALGGGRRCQTRAVVSGVLVADPGRGDGVMFRFRDPSGVSALDMVQDVPAAGSPPVRMGVAARP